MKILLILLLLVLIIVAVLSEYGPYSRVCVPDKVKNINIKVI